MRKVQIVFEPYAPDELKKVLHEGVILHNVAATGDSEHYPVAFFLKADTGEVLGGLLGHIWGGWLEISLLPHLPAKTRDPFVVSASALLERPQRIRTNPPATYREVRPQRQR